MPLVNTSVAPGLGIWRIGETVAELSDRLEKKAWYMPFLQHTASESRRTEWLAVRVLLKELLGREVRIEYTEAGRPYLPEETLCVSISHTPGYAAVLLSDSPAPGIDIERISARVARVAPRFLSEQELRQIDPERPTESLLLYWSGKETVFKALQRQDVDFRRQIYIHPFSVGTSGCFRAEERRTEQGRFYRLAYRLTDEYVLTYTALP